MGRASRRKRERRSGPGLELPGAPREPFGARSLPVLRNPPGHKISAALLELLDPYLLGPLSLEEVQTVVALGALAWNLSLGEESQRSREVQDLVRKSRDAHPELLAATLRDLIARKLALFGADRRLVVSWEVKESADQYRLLAAAVDLGTDEPGT